MYAIVEISGKQYRVQEKDSLFVPSQNVEPGKSVSFDRVLLVSDNGDVQVGTPTLKGAVVKAKVLDHVKADKVLVFKKRRRKRYKVKRGHRQPYTQIEVSSIKVK